MRKRLDALDWPKGYAFLYRNNSHAIHGTWVDLLMNNLKYIGPDQFDYDPDCVTPTVAMQMSIAADPDAAVNTSRRCQLGHRAANPFCNILTTFRCEPNWLVSGSKTFWQTKTTKLRPSFPRVANPSMVHIHPEAADVRPESPINRSRLRPM